LWVLLLLGLAPFSMIASSILLFCFKSSLSLPPRSAIILNKSLVIALLFPNDKNHILPLIVRGSPSIHRSLTRLVFLTLSQFGIISVIHTFVDASILFNFYSYCSLFLSTISYYSLFLLRYCYLFCSTSLVYYFCSAGDLAGKLSGLKDIWLSWILLVLPAVTAMYDKTFELNMELKILLLLGDCMLLMELFNIYESNYRFILDWSSNYLLFLLYNSLV